MTPKTAQKPETAQKPLPPAGPMVVLALSADIARLLKASLPQDTRLDPVKAEIDSQLARAK